eukprot:Polyplicarium_translucidae@DN563_c0_g1_i1.p1
MRACLPLILAIASGQTCPFAVDLVLVQDLTGSFGYDLTNIQNQVPSFFADLLADRPGSRMGIVSFTDIPLDPLGVPGEDTCGRLEVALTDDTSTFEAAVNGLAVGAGGDPPEGQLIGVQHGLLAPGVDWRPSGALTSGGVPVYNLLVLATDDTYHVAGDGTALGLAPNSGSGAIACGAGGEDYPSAAQISTALSSKGAVFAVLVAAAHKAEYAALINETVGHESGFVTDLASDSSDLEEKLRNAVDYLTATACPSACEENTAIELIYVQDLSYSQAERLPALKTVVPAAVTEVRSRYPSSRFGLVSHTDKPIRPFGWSVSLDYCYWLHMPVSGDIDFFTEAMNDMTFRSGADWPEATMDALFQVATDPGVGLTSTAVDGEGRSVKRVIIAVSDAAPHLAGDGGAVGLIPHDGLPGLDCEGVDYPSGAQVAAALAAIGAGDTSVAFGVPVELVSTFAAIALQWTSAGVPTFVYTVGDAAEGVAKMIVEMADPCTPNEGRRLEAATHQLMRQLSLPTGAPHVQLQPAVRP